MWFRESCREEAALRGVAGWVRNLPDGRVEAVFEGDRDAVDAMVTWCHEGPPRARVRAVELLDELPGADLGFKVL